MSGYKNLDDLKKSIHAQMEILTIQERVCVNFGRKYERW